MLNKILYLKKHEDRRLRHGHLWIYSNEVDVAQSPLQNFTAGEIVNVQTHKGEIVGSAYINPHTLICARLFSHQADESLTKELLIERLHKALALREQLFNKPFYRLVFGESDYLPGLIVDRFGDVIVAQLNTAGTDAARDVLRDALITVLNPTAILLRNDSSVRELEGLPRLVETLHGEPPKTVEIIENNCRFAIPIWEGQKTGWFYDQHANRSRLQSYVKNKRVLDVFSYIGAWSVQAAKLGATEVCAVDSSAQATTGLQNNAKLNQVETKIRTINEDAFKALVQLYDDKQKFDVIVLDPPAFMKRRKDIKPGLNAYRRLHELAVRLLNPGGILISASCSMHLARENLVEVIQLASNHHGRFAQILEQGHQAPDHPIYPAIPETSYLKAFIARIL